VADTFTRGFVKICGVTNPQDARDVAASGADALGVIFAASPRRMEPGRAREVLEAAGRSLMRVAVFRGQPDGEVLAVLDEVDVDAVQVHGPLGRDLLDALRARSLLVVKALGVDDEDFASFDERLVDAVLVDGPRPGSGSAHSWDPLARRHFRGPFIAAGGLTPDSVATTIVLTGAWGVDCASGVEAAPGRKDRALVEAFVAGARFGFASLEDKW
jgi:phosphoribosylanthranilate isomerase